MEKCLGTQDRTELRLESGICWLKGWSPRRQRLCFWATPLRPLYSIPSSGPDEGLLWWAKRSCFRGCRTYLFATAATISFALAVYLALHDRIRASGLLAGLAFVAALLAYLPQLDSLSAFAVNVKLRSNLDRADEILVRLRSLTIVNAKLAYTTLA